MYSIIPKLNVYKASIKSIDWLAGTLMMGKYAAFRTIHKRTIIHIYA